MTIQRVTKTDALIEQFKSWNGPAWFRAHLDWLKGSYQVAQASKNDGPYFKEAITKPKTRPYINEEKQDDVWKYLVSQFGKRQAKKMLFPPGHDKYVP